MAECCEAGDVEWAGKQSWLKLDIAPFRWRTLLVESIGNITLRRKDRHRTLEYACPQSIVMLKPLNAERYSLLIEPPVVSQESIPSLHGALFRSNCNSLISESV
jgi:hypothetical protein